MSEPIRERILADAAAHALQPLDAYRRMAPGREAEAERAYREATAGSHPSGPPLEAATRATVGLDALRRQGSARLTLGAVIGSGGMGEVLQARDEVLRRELALKRVRFGEGGSEGPLPEGGPATAPSPLTRRLLEEAQITAQLDHPGVVPVHELGVDEAGRPYFTMKRVHGHTLDEHLRREREGRGRSLGRTLQVFVRLCETLAYAHRKGVVHRDIKPANVMIGRFGEVYLMDWGLAKLRGEPSMPTPDAPAAGATGVITTQRSELLRQGADASLTQHGQVVGTLGYLPPEQLVGGVVDERSDLYAVGAMLYELLAGHAPYCEPDPAPDLRRTLMRMMKEPPTPLARLAPEAPPELVSIAHKALDRDPARRFASAVELADELHAFLDGRVVRSHRTGLWIELRKWVGRNRWLAAGLGLALLAAAGTVAAFVAQQRSAAIAVGRERDRAQAEAQRAQAAGRRADGLRLAAQSRLLSDDPGLALALAVEAGRRAPGPAASGAIYHALRRHYEHRYLAGHESYLVQGEWTSDGRGLVSGDETGLVIAWDVEGEAPRLWLEGPAAAVRALSIAPGDERVAVAYADGHVRVWDLASGAEAATLPFDATSLRFLERGRVLVAGTDGSVETWEVAGGARRVLARAGGPARLAEGLPADARSVPIAARGRVLLVDLENGTSLDLCGASQEAPPLCVLGQAAGEVMVRWSPGDARVYAFVDGRERRVVAPGMQVDGAAYSADGTRLALALHAPDGPPQVVVLDVGSGATLTTLPLDASVALQFTRDRRGLVAVDRVGATWVELGPRPHMVPLRGHRYTVVGGALSPDDRFLATVAHDMTARVWALHPEGERAALVARVEAGQRVLGWSADASRALVALAPEDGKGRLEVVDTADGRVAARFDIPAGEVRGGLDDTGGRAWWLAGRAWRVVDVSTGTPVRTTELAASPPIEGGVWPSPDGRFLAAHASDHLSVYDQRTGALVGRVGVGMQPMRPTWAPDGTHLVVAHPPRAMSALYRYDGAEPLRTFVGHSGFVTDARADPLNRYIASVAADSTVRLFDLGTGASLDTFRGLPLRGARLAWGPRGEVLAVTTSKHVMLEVSPPGHLREAFTLERANDEVLNLHPDGRRFWLVDEHQRARLWGLDAVAEGLRALRRPVLRQDALPDYEPGAESPLDAPWLARKDAWWTLERAQRLLVAGQLEDAERAIDDAARQRPRWAAPALERVRLAARRATAAGADRESTVRDLVRLLEAAREIGTDRLVTRGWHVAPPELAAYADDPRLQAVLATVVISSR